MKTPTAKISFNKPSDLPMLLTLTEAAKELRVSVRTLNALNITYVLIGKRKCYRQEELASFIENNQYRRVPKEEIDQSFVPASTYSMVIDIEDLRKREAQERKVREANEEKRRQKEEKAELKRLSVNN